MKKIKCAFFGVVLCIASVCINIFVACSSEPLKYEEQTGTQQSTGEKITVYEVSAKNTNISGEIVIPCEYNGKRVVLKNYAFKDCTKITKIILSEGFTSIGHYAFQSCGDPIVVIPTSVTSIKDTAFKNNSIYRIEYQGTQEQWEQINSYTFVPSTIHIICTDGEFVR